MTDSAGNEVQRIEYLPFGKTRAETGISSTRYKFTGKELDEETSLYYFGARYYDPELGRFITSDPIQSGVNWYVYTANNPLRYVDPWGLRLAVTGSMNEEEKDPNGQHVWSGDTQYDSEHAVKNINKELDKEIKEASEQRDTGRLVKALERRYAGFNYDPKSITPLATQLSTFLQGEPTPLVVGVSGNLTFYGGAYQIDLNNGTLHQSKTFLPTPGVGGSLDVQVGKGNIETSVGLHRYLSVGILWDLKDDGKASFSGVAVHVGPGVSLPVNISVEIPKEIPLYPWEF